MTPDAASHRRALRWTLVGLGVFVLVVGGILAWARFGPISRHPFDEAVARAEAAGLAVRVEDLPEWDAAAARAGSAEFDYAMLALDVAGPPWRSGLTGPWDYDVEQPWYEHAGAERIEALRGCARLRVSRPPYAPRGRDRGESCGIFMAAFRPSAKIDEVEPT